MEIHQKMIFLYVMCIEKYTSLQVIRSHLSWGREKERKDEDGVSGDGKVTFMTAAIQLTNVFCVL